MVYTCCIPQCNTGYRSSKTVEKIAMFRFPTDQDLLQKWIRAIPRENLNITKSTRICAKHFSEEDFETLSSDQCESRQKKRDTRLLKRIRLKSTAIPNIFHGLPKYLSKSVPKKRSTTGASSSARLENENLLIQSQNEKLLELDQVKNLIELKLKLCNASLPVDIVTVEKEQTVEFHYIYNSNSSSIAPILRASILIEESMCINAFVDHVLLPKSMYKHLMKFDKINTLTEVCNIVAFCKNLCSDLKSGSISNCNAINLAISSLSHFQILDECDSETFMSVVKFLIEQLKLMQIPKGRRRYSPELITMSFLWKLSSSSLYKRLSEFFILPSTRRLQQLSTAFNVDTGNIDASYLKQRAATLTEGERTVVLLIDEVYTAQRVEYSNGSFIGLTEEGHPAKTVLAFMVQSICKSYKDMVCLVPIEKLDTKLLRFYFNLVMTALDEIFFVAAVSVDNHVCNRKLYMELCGGNELSSSVVHPTKPNERLFLLFDFTHNMKNIFNNFINRKVMHIPEISDDYNIFGGKCIAQFAHIKRLYALEEHKPLKVAHTLKKVSLNPSNIARTSPQHALSVFSESTFHALELFSNENPGFHDTAKFVKFISNIWKIMTVQTPYKGIEKKDDMCMPLSFENEKDQANLQYLHAATKIFIQWKKSSCSGLTDPTFLACIQTMSAVPKLALYLHHKLKLRYILPGKLTSDPIEGRFGWYRQANGGNFFMSIKQLLEAEKKIRTLSLLQQRGLVRASKLNADIEEDECTQSSSNDANEIVSQAKWLTEHLLVVAVYGLEDLAENDANLAFYVSGYIARSITRRRKCSSCKSMLMKNEDAPSLPVCDSEDHSKLFEMADRGGLAVPSEYCFAVTTLAVQCYTAILADEAAKTKMMTVANQRSVFVTSVKRLVAESSHYCGMLHNKCLRDHCNFELILQIVFNCFAKNELKRLNAPRTKAPDMMARKVRKLTSGSSTKTAS